MAVTIRAERPEDSRAVAWVNQRAFGQPAEANLVAALRKYGAQIISLVALQDSRIAAHIIFSPVTITTENGSACLAAGLGPVAVLPSLQNLGTGSALIRFGLHVCRERGYRAAIVLGHSSYYPRFGFVKSTEFGIRWEHEAPEEAFMALELVPGGLAGCAGIARYLPEFEGV